MKTILSAVLLAGFAFTAWSATTIDPANKSAYGANIAWLNWQGDIANGAVVTDDICSGSIWSANCGWIHLGNGAPPDGPQYQNDADNDYGVNLDAAGNLSGFAYGANIGWLNFHPFGQPKIDLLTGNFSGDVWSANCGWMNLSNMFAHVKTLVVLPAMDSDKDGLPDSWELRFARSLDALTGNDDSDGDGVSNHDEALADTNPLDANDALRITGLAFKDGECTIQWQSRPTRLYRVLKQADLDLKLPWKDVGAGMILPRMTWETDVKFKEPGPQGFFRIEAVKPLAP
ncbi:MAG TPA: thrombospondin type 3 repeat-containing protein [Haliangiales bacterium]|nr:thrombospondin type 3 repeat-containing protein [Haliangiales bacterium]